MSSSSSSLPPHHRSGHLILIFIIIHVSSLCLPESFNPCLTLPPPTTDPPLIHRSRHLVVIDYSIGTFFSAGAVGLIMQVSFHDDYPIPSASQRSELDRFDLSFALSILSQFS